MTDPVQVDRRREGMKPPLFVRPLSPDEGTACLHEKSHRPRSARPALDAARCERLRAVLHRSPRDFGKPTGVWTLATAAGVCHEQGITDRLVSREAIRQALKRLGIGWK